MRISSVLLFVATAGLAGCAREGPGGNSSSADGTGAAAAVVACTQRNAQGQCMQRLCIQDTKSDCADFAESCIKSGDAYEGTSQTGKCTKASNDVS